MDYDDKLAQLMSLGFEVDLCQSALSHTTTVESATEWILNALDNPETPLHNMSLSNNPPQLSEDAQRQRDEESARNRLQSEKLYRESKRNKQLEKKAHEQALQQIKEDREKMKLLRGAPKSKDVNEHTSASEATRKEYARTQQDIKRQRRLDQEAKARALEEIRQDREAMKLRKAQHALISTTASTSASAAAPSTDRNDSRHVAPERGNTALIQFRLSDGSTVRQQFQATDNLATLFHFVAGKEDHAGKPLAEGEGLKLISAYPRKEFSIQDAETTVQAAGFVPNVSLSISRMLPPQSPVAEDAEMEEAENVQDEARGTEHMDTDGATEESSEEEDAGGDENEDQAMDPIDHILHNQPAINPHRPRRNIGRTPVLRRDRIMNPNWNWGTGGHRLVGDEPERQEQADQESEQQQEQANARDADARRDRLSAIERRVAPVQAQPIMKFSSTGKGRHIPSLRDTCTASVAGMLVQQNKEAQDHLRYLMFASNKVAELLLAQLTSTRKLERLTMRKLADSCYLQNVVLDSYTYATDSLLEELSMSNTSSTVAKLSLKGCDVITDHGIQCLEGLKNLEYLDVSNCKVTDKGLLSITKLSKLRHLNLSKTKITDAGLRQLANHSQFRSHLQSLSLDGCRGIKASDTFSLLDNAFPELVQLSLASTEIRAQTTVPRRSLQHLQVLDASRTGLGDDDMTKIVASFSELRELKLGGCMHVTTRGLAALARDLKRLEMIQFPNREEELDGILARYAELPLVHLDLTGFLQVTDVGVQSIARMHHLQYLSLGGTKVTDAGVALLAALTDLRKLYLDRTAVSDAGLVELSGLTKLDTLSLSRTQVGNVGLINLGDGEHTAYTRHLRTLNLAQCALVSDRGVRGLAGAINLSHLNLDQTGVSKHCLRHLEGLKNLKPVRLLGIEREDDDEIPAEQR
ncbi:hypothetical protein BCR43DRAFT_493116 [Syncephalastrum racemosum]|uniref:UBX domain-containing protein n=1 Tax=Syncephalastrum racemosum TaxID=13706 RepID=A0A1X2HA17_SYNRA|nr:hypothetical protein BCR43DRAFT_493116 [Syncephalastrum racemosum]